MDWCIERIKKGLQPIYTIDFETDPFAHGRVPVPFVCGFYDGLEFRALYSDKHSTCVEKLRCHLEDSGLEPGIVYAHNGGRFDFFYLLDFFEGRATIINSRIVCAYMPKGEGKRRFDKDHRFEFRDSYAIMPFPLKAYQKEEMPIAWLARDQREKHRDEIHAYLKGDCVYLWDLCMGFQQEFGDFKTIASAAFTQLCEFHHYDTLPLKQDEEIRSRFYFGGRVQCFEKGVIKTPVTIYDVNSMYPYVMDSYFHPTSWCVHQDTKVHGWNPDGTMDKHDKYKTFFLTVEGENDGAFPVRKKDGSVDFTELYGTFHTTIHEYLVAVELDLFKTKRIHNTYNFIDYSKFHLFVDHFYKAREKAKQDGDKMHSLFYKYILNSAYGKFGLNPENYHNWEITKTAQAPKGQGWELDSIVQDKFYVWKQPSQLFWNVKNIATAASITGAARSVLLRAVAISDNVLYCDTDSIICAGFAGGRVDDKKLGAWKMEGAGVCAAIAGKKMYAIFDSEGACVKHANKGVDLTPKQILQLANGEEILAFREAPTFKRDGSATFIHRTVKMT